MLGGGGNKRFEEMVLRSLWRPMRPLPLGVCVQPCFAITSNALRSPAEPS